MAEEINKYIDVLKEYNTNLIEDEITASVNKIISENYEANNRKEIYKKLYNCIDLTSLTTTDTKQKIWQLTQNINDFEGSTDIENVAAICVYPNFVNLVKEALTAQDVKIACVTGGFPSSQTFTEVKIAETALAIASGADEIDTVLNLGLFFEENYEELCEEIEEIKHCCRTAILKIILETGALQNASNIMKAAILALYSGADFLKTSTGKGYDGATLESAYIICSAIKEYYKKTNRKVGIKVSGGISNTQDALKYYTIVKEVLGDEWCNNKLFRIGSSKLEQDLLKHIN